MRVIQAEIWKENAEIKICKKRKDLNQCNCSYLIKQVSFFFSFFLGIFGILALIWLDYKHDYKAEHWRSSINY